VRFAEPSQFAVGDSHGLNFGKELAASDLGSCAGRRGRRARVANQDAARQHRRNKNDCGANPDASIVGHMASSLDQGV
jgi:hypothetical protein